jgi:hypothetical protein
MTDVQDSDPAVDGHPPGWWQATNGRWYAPDRRPRADVSNGHPGPAPAPLGPDWDLADDGYWYPARTLASEAGAAAQGSTAETTTPNEPGERPEDLGLPKAATAEAPADQPDAAEPDAAEPGDSADAAASIENLPDLGAESAGTGFIPRPMIADDTTSGDLPALAGTDHLVSSVATPVEEVDAQDSPPPTATTTDAAPQVDTSDESAANTTEGAGALGDHEPHADIDTPADLSTGDDRDDPDEADEANEPAVLEDLQDGDDGTTPALLEDLEEVNSGEDLDDLDSDDDVVELVAEDLPELAGTRDATNVVEFPGARDGGQDRSTMNPNVPSGSRTHTNSGNSSDGDHSRSWVQRRNEEAPLTYQAFGDAEPSRWPVWLMAASIVAALCVIALLLLDSSLNNDSDSTPAPTSQVDTSTASTASTANTVTDATAPTTEVTPSTQAGPVEGALSPLADGSAVLFEGISERPQTVFENRVNSPEGPLTDAGTVDTPTTFGQPARLGDWSVWVFGTGAIDESLTAEEGLEAVTVGIIVGREINAAADDTAPTFELLSESLQFYPQSDEACGGSPIYPASAVASAEALRAVAVVACWEVPAGDANYADLTLLATSADSSGAFSLTR